MNDKNSQPIDHDKKLNKIEGNVSPSEKKFSQKFQFFNKMATECNQETIENQCSNTELRLLCQKSTTETNLKPIDSNEIPIEPPGNRDLLVKSKIDSFEKDFMKFGRFRTSSQTKMTNKEDQPRSIMRQMLSMSNDADDNLSMGENSDDSNFDSGKENFNSPIIEKLSHHQKSTTLIENRRNKINSTNKSLLISSGYSNQLKTSSLWDASSKIENQDNVGIANNKTFVSKSVMLEARSKLVEKLDEDGMKLKIRNISPAILQRSNVKSHQFIVPQLIPDLKTALLPGDKQSMARIFELVTEFEELINDLSEHDIDNAEREFAQLFVESVHDVELNNADCEFDELFNGTHFIFIFL